MVSKTKNVQEAAPLNKEKSKWDLDSDERYHLPRSISPIGLFFGHGAVDPRRENKNANNIKADNITEADIVRERYVTKSRTRPPIGTQRTRPFISLVVTVAMGAFYMIILKMPLNPQIPEFWVFLVWLCVVYIACMMFLRGSKPKG